MLHILSLCRDILSLPQPFTGTDTNDLISVGHQIHYRITIVIILKNDMLYIPVDRFHPVSSVIPLQQSPTGFHIFAESPWYSAFRYRAIQPCQCTTVQIQYIAEQGCLYLRAALYETYA
jgi:hypothetical protein